MPTLEEWKNALMVPRKVTVNSTDATIEAVKTRQEQRQNVEAKTITKVAAFDPAKEIDIAPITLLHALGVTTTPPVPNLADLSSTWALLRYIWAFDIPVTPEQGIAPTIPLRLSEVAAGIDFHQKGLLSDEIGIAISTVIMGEYLGTPHAVDVSLALDEPTFSLIHSGKASPDYVFFDASGSKMYIVECKGTQTSRSVAYNQLRRGTEQLPSLKFSYGKSPDSFVIATYISTKATEVFIIDPPGNEDEGKEGDELRERQPVVQNEEEVKTRASKFYQAKLLNFSGDEGGVALKIDDKFPSVRFLRKGVRAEEPLITEVGVYIGTAEILPVRDNVSLTVYRGIQRDLREAFISNDSKEAQSVLSRMQQSLNEFSNRNTNDREDRGGDEATVPLCSGTRTAKPFFTEEIEEGDVIKCRSYGIDGTVLEMVLSSKA